MIALFLSLALQAPAPSTTVPTEAAPPPPPATAAPAVVEAALATSPAPAPAPAPAADTAAPEAKGPKIYVVDPALVKLPSSLKLTVSQAIASTVESEGFSGITRDDVKTVLDQQADLALLGGDADGAALGALGQAVGAGHIVAAVVTAIDGDTLVQARLIDTGKMSVLARRELKASETGGELLRAVADVTRLVLQPLFADARATLALTISEEGANVLVDGKQLGVSPVKPLGLTGGYHLVTVTKQGFVSFQETIKAENGQTITRDVKLRPSVEFLTDYRARNGLYRTLAWTTTGLTLLAAAAAGASGYMLMEAIDNTAAVSADAQKKIEDGSFPEGSPGFVEQQARVTEAKNAEGTWSFATPTIAAVGGVGLLLASYFWIFGDDPDRYAEYEEQAAAQAR